MDGAARRNPRSRTQPFSLPQRLHQDLGANTGEHMIEMPITVFDSFGSLGWVPGPTLYEPFQEFDFNLAIWNSE